MLGKLLAHWRSRQTVESDNRPMDRLPWLAKVPARPDLQPLAQWAADEPLVQSAPKLTPLDADAPANLRLWTSFPPLKVLPKFQIDPSEPVFAMGSCFAREVEEALTRLGFDVPTHCDALFDQAPLTRDQSSPGSRARGFLNRYNSLSMLDEVRHLLGLAPAFESGRLIYRLGRDDAADLHYSASLPRVDFKTSLSRRHAVRAHLGPALRRSSLFILTLGMAECWFDRDQGHFLNNTPSPKVLARYGPQLEVRLTSFAQHAQALECLHACLTAELRHEFKLVITVSPVPLQRTYIGQDIVVTNQYSKAMLRAVAQEFAARHPNVDYFPSYEIVTVSDPSQSWMWDHRHVKVDTVAHVMQLFQRHYAPTPTISR